MRPRTAAEIGARPPAAERPEAEALQRPRTAAEIPGRPPATQLLHCEHPQVLLTWGSQLPVTFKPDKLKLRKHVDLWPIRVTLKADYETRTRDFTYGVSCKASGAGGRDASRTPPALGRRRRRRGRPRPEANPCRLRCAVQDRLLNGRFSVNLPTQTVEYR